MRIQAIVITSLLAVCLGTACDKKADDKKADDKKADDKKADDKAADAGDVKAAEPEPEPEPAKPEEAAAVETSPEMTAFLAKFDGTDAAVKAALTEFGADEAVVDDDMGMFSLGKPKVVAKDGDCYTFETEAGITIRTYNVCWAEGKINKIEDKGMR
jgi:hypothetical protein